METTSNDYCIRYALIEDALSIRDFIEKEWKAGHILSRDKDFFTYEHVDDQHVNFVIAESATKDILGLLGFIKCSKEPLPDIFTVIWKVSKSNSNPFLGVELLQFLRKSRNYRTIMSSGINEKTKGIYQYLEMHTGQLDQFVLLNPAVTHYQIARVSQIAIPPIPHSGSGCIIKPLTWPFNYDFSLHQDQIPYKDEEYFKKRYVDHPIYKYNIYGLLVNHKVNNIFVTRVQAFENSRVLRIVDYYGDLTHLDAVANFLSGEIAINHYEYADFVCYGFDEKEMQRSGFLKVDPADENLIVPNYFSPFLQSNVVVNFFVDSAELSKVRICKADGDQDRPN